jgi:flagellin
MLIILQLRLRPANLILGASARPRLLKKIDFLNYLEAWLKSDKHNRQYKVLPQSKHQKNKTLKGRLVMGLVVNTNTQSLFAQRALSRNTDGLKRNIERLSTGYRINRASDDAAGLSISNKLTTTIRGLEKAKQNASDGISLLQTAEGGLSVIQENLQRIRELVVQGVNGTNGPEEKNALQREINERVKIVNDIAEATSFNGISLLYNNTGTDADITLQTGSSGSEKTILSFRSEQTNNTGVEIDIAEISGGGNDQGHLIEGTATNFALDRIQLEGATVNSFGYDGYTKNGTSQAAHSTNFIATVDDVDKMIGNISRMRSYIGASQNALESKIDYMDIAIENASASRSRIQDVDVAYESSILVRNQILQQTASTMLSQANSQPQIALSLLGQ